jgi:hypothetical protein
MRAELRGGHLLASVDEDGNLMVIDTSKRHRLPPIGALPDTPRDGVEITRLHRNAIFDVAWADYKPILVCVRFVWYNESSTYYGYCRE